MRKTLLIFIAILTGLTLPVAAEIKPAPVFTNNMVIQQGKSIPIWGKASAGEKITLKFMKQTVHAVANEEGEWKATLNSIKACKEPHDLIIKGKQDKVILKNILVGEVWLASGQSNMEYSMNNHPHHARPKKGDPERLYKEFKAANNPLIRVMYIQCASEGEILPTTGWQMLSDETLAPISAAGYFFAKNIADSLDVPVGIISSSWGGSLIESWTPKEAYLSSPILNDGMKDGKYYGLPVGNHYDPMIAPLAPYAMRGFLWYQGEANVLDQRGADYDVKQRTLIRSWRKAWNDETMPFYFVQLAPYLYSDRTMDEKGVAWDALPKFWKMQEATLDVPYTGMAVINDLVDKLNDIHPPYKWVVGERLARLALKNTYGKAIVCSGPTFKQMNVEDNKVIITFDHADGLKTRDGKEPDNFKLRNYKGYYFKRKAQITGNAIVIQLDSTIARPVTVRFAWDEKAQPNLCNSEELPAVPFQAKEEPGTQK